MKKRLSIILTVIFAVSVMLGYAIFATGCISSHSKDLNNSVWKIDLNASSSDVKKDYSEDMTIVFSDDHVEIINGGDLNSRYNKIEYAEIEDGVLRCGVSFADDGIRSFYIKGDTLSFSIYYYDYNSQYKLYDFVFYRDGTKPSEGTGGNNNGDNDGDSTSHFDAIKRAYQNDGYDVDMSSSSLDSNMQAAINALQEAYAMMGYKLCYISKRGAFSYELYMLISTDTVEAAKDIEDAYSSICARSGKDVIISVGTTKNFEPFHDATK